VTWVKLDDHFAEDAAVADLTDRAFRLHVIALCYCGRNLTDGFLDERAVRVVGAVLTASRTTRWVNELVDAGLWISRESGGYDIKSYLDFNPSAAQVKDERRKAKERMNRRRSEERSGEQPPEPTPERSPTPSRPVPINQETSNAMPVDNWGDIHSRYFKWADEIGFVGKPHAEALRLRPEFLEEAMRRVRSRQDVENQAAYLTTVVRDLSAAQALWRSTMPLEERLLIYVQNAGHHYDDETLAYELEEKKADPAMIARLLVKANERRAAA
jgi:hypothetical protein